MTSRKLVFFKRLRNLDGAQRADVAVVVAAFRNRVNMGTHHERLQTQIASGPSAHDVAGRIDTYVKPGAAHQAHNVAAPLSVSLAEGDPADAALRVLAELRKGSEVFDYSRAVDSQAGLRRT